VLSPNKQQSNVKSHESKDSGETHSISFRKLEVNAIHNKKASFFAAESVENISVKNKFWKITYAWNLQKIIPLGIYIGRPSTKNVY